MSKYLPLLVTVLVTVASALSPQGQALIAAHPAVAASLSLVATVLHAALPSIFKQ